MGPKIGVLCGGLSAEREVSLKTGEAIYKALLKNKYNAVKIDVDKNIAENLKINNIELAFVALHGKYGEDGTIQGLLEILGIPYTGSDVLASATAINKIATKKVMAYEGIPTPGYFAVSRWEYTNNPGSIASQIEKLGLPVVVKAATQGSTIGISFVNTKEQISNAFEDAFKYDDNVLVEKMIDGIEITASVLGNESPQALPLIEIVSATGIYDYKAKYTVGLSDHIIPPRINNELQEKIKTLAIRTYQAVGCRGLARVDFMVDASGKAYALEVNTIPGMTETSLFPDAAKAAGISFEALVKKLVDLAVPK
ncbi:D-alanine-D-alanine ligase [Desulfotomaculum arcticum]|uniref:D-alanine--D-alanine ligase n=1 Tax=Desulfotruncus arcticus DSM 17038 TaxID=1121424 RepID=A0A1I2S020_9FIRM|nr:D-alanine--D-alanine ligase [Desulfotruncus arcticus]SFG45673.1 D-alanine-D-alanine ligase [Desulfotomaculum arcticum] [Desulfotruncus arcticus DSM 17038]